MDDNALAEITMLSDEDKKDLAETILEELGLTVRSINKAGEMVIPCTVTGYHSDQNKHPTAALNYKKMLFHCLGCHSSGTVLWFVAETLGLGDSDKALQWVKERAGLHSVMDIGDLLRYFDHVYERPEAKPIPQYSPKTLLPWLMPDHVYFHQRGIDVMQALEFQLGYNPDSDSVVIPHYFNGVLVGWQTRKLSGFGPKYKNSTDFPRESTLYNYKPKIDPIVVESSMSVLRHDDKPYHLEATFGANVTDTQISLLAKHQRVYLWYDNDKAGWGATRSVCDRLGPSTDVWVVQSPWEQDPGDLPSTEFQRLVRDALPSALWSPPARLERYGHA